MEIISERPIAESYEYRPPTQSQNSNMFSVSIPNLSTSRVFVDTAMKWFCTADSSPSASNSHFRAEQALAHVINLLTKVHSVSQIEQQLHRLVGKAVLRIVEIQVTCLKGHRLTALRILGKEVAKVHALCLLVMSLVCFPLRLLDNGTFVSVMVLTPLSGSLPCSN